MNFVFVSLQRINTDRESTSTSLAKELSKQHRVLYVNPPIDRRTSLNEQDQDQFVRDHIIAIKNKKETLKRCSESLWELNPESIIESLNWIPITSIFSFFNYYNNKRFAGNIKKALKEIGFDSFILVNDKDIFRSFYLKELLKPELSIYLDRDYTLGFDYWKRHGISLEPKLIAKSDGVVCNSEDFRKRASQYNPKSFYIGNGSGLSESIVNATNFDLPRELKDIPHPIVGYVGVLTAHRLDLVLIAHLAANLKEASIVLIGPEDEDFKNSGLHGMDNVYFIPKKDKSEIPAYVHFFDVCINPQVKNEITMGNFPLKIVEYLAMGKSTVATRTNTMTEVFSSVTYLADTPDEFTAQIQLALAENNEDLIAHRRNFSRKFSWENVTKEFLTAVEHMQKDGKKH